MATLKDYIQLFLKQPICLSKYSMNTFYDPNPENINCIQNALIRKSIFLKLRGSAEEKLQVYFSHSWKVVENLLNTHFGDKEMRAVNCQM